MGLNKWPGLLDSDNCVLISLSQSRNRASADEKGASTALIAVLINVSRMSILSSSRESSSLSNGKESINGGFMSPSNGVGDSK